MLSLGFGVSGFLGLGFRISGFGFRASGCSLSSQEEFRAWGNRCDFRFRVLERARPPPQKEPWKDTHTPLSSSFLWYVLNHIR